MSEIIDYLKNSSMTLGSGYDFTEHSVKLSPFNQPIAKTTLATPSVESFLWYVEDTSSMSEALQIGAEGVYDTLMFEASVKCDFVMESKIDNYSLLFVVAVRSAKTADLISSPHVSTEALNVLTNGGALKFRQAYGDRYVSSVTHGGELYGMIRIEAQTVLEREKLHVEAKQTFNSLLTYAQAKEKFDHFMQKNASHLSITVAVKSSGVSKIQTPQNVADLFQLVKDFPTLVANEGAPVKVELRPIDELPQITMAVQKIDETTQQAMQLLSDHYLGYYMLSNSIGYMLEHQNQFDFDAVHRDVVMKERDKVKKVMGDLKVLSDKLLHGTVAHDNPAIRDFTPAYEFDNSLKLPNPIVSVAIPEISIFPLRNHTHGDTEMDGHRPKITMNAKLEPSADRKELRLTVDIEMKENKKDWTTFADSWSGQVYDLKYTGYQIVSLNMTSGALNAQAGEDDHSWHIYTGTGLIVHADCRSDVKGKETGKIGARSVKFASPRVVIKQDPPKDAAPKVKKVALKTVAERRKERSRFWLLEKQ